jgi:ASC-1-like (ASCH) protein
MGTTHNIKILPNYLIEVKSGEKKFELRKNDRDYKVGDTLCLEEWCSHFEGYTGKEFYVNVTNVLKGGVYGLDKDFVIMSITPKQ